VEVAAGMKKITAIKNAISNNQFKEAMRLNRDLLKYSQAHTDKNVDMYEMEAMTATLGTEIRKAREKQIELKEKEAQAYNEEMQNRIEAVKEKWADEENPGTKLSKEEQQQAKKEAKELALETKKAKMLEQKALLEAEKIKQASLQEEMKFQEELKRAAIEKDNKLKQEAIQTKHLQPRPIVQGSMSGNFKGSSSRGRISLTVNGKSVNGSFSGIYDDSKISGSVSGSYNPSTGKLKARLSGRWKFGSDSGSLAGSITGTQRGSGFSGTGQASGGGSDFGTWSVSGGQIIQPQGK
jgi:preprotein translocase subunit SecD